MSKLFSIHYIRLTILVVTILNFHIAISIAKPLSDKELEGYEVKFDYEGHLEERKIAYDFFLKQEPDNLSALKSEEIGIDLFDIDDDGEKEILIYIYNSNYCGSRGCSFEILKSCTSDSGHKYKPIPLDVTVHDNIKILNTTTKGYHDIDFNGAVWKWDGNKYQFYKLINQSRG
jgi:hypothetical protein